jgi:hypothetical protein
MTPGRLLYLLRRKFHGGLRVSYYREIVRPRILKTAPVTDTTDFTCEIHVLTSGEDWLNLMWALKSFYHFSQRRYALCIHDDGSLCPEVLTLLRQHFPAARLIPRGVADEVVLQSLRDYPRSLAFRRTNTLSLKLFDFAHFLESDRLLLLDSDVLFFEFPADLIQRIEDPSYKFNVVNRDTATAYTISRECVKSSDFKLIERFNSGLGMIHKSSIQLDWVEEFLGLPGIHSHFWTIEQTLFALLSSRYGVELLPDSYTVSLDKDVPLLQSRHYVGAIRTLFYSQGIRRLVSSPDFA